MKKFLCFLTGHKFSLAITQDEQGEHFHFTCARCGFKISKIGVRA